MVSLFTACDLASRNYPDVNRDLLLTGAFLHDVGKVHELTYQRSIAYTTKGQLLGHMIIELEMLHEKIARLPGFPDDLKILLEHLIISHHGQYEYGSPKLPMFPEALMLHYLDDLDSKMEAMRAQFEREADLESPWTSYNPSLARPLLNTQKFLNKEAVREKAAETPQPMPAPATEDNNPEVAEAVQEEPSWRLPMLPQPRFPLSPRRSTPCNVSSNRTASLPPAIRATSLCSTSASSNACPSIAMEP